MIKLGRDLKVGFSSSLSNSCPLLNTRIVFEFLKTRFKIKADIESSSATKISKG